MRDIISISRFNYALIPPKGFRDRTIPAAFLLPSVSSCSRSTAARAPLSRNKCAERIHARRASGQAGNWVTHGNRWTDIDITICKLSVRERDRKRDLCCRARFISRKWERQRERREKDTSCRGSRYRSRYSPKSRAVCCRPLLLDTPARLCCCFTDSQCLSELSSTTTPRVN